MFRKSMLAGATALAILGFAVSAQAVSLGDLTVESKPGEPPPSFPSKDAEGS